MTARWLARTLLSRESGTGELAPPGCDVAPVHYVEADGRELGVVSKGLALDLWFGRRTFVSHHISARHAVRLGWWLLWTYWVCGLWCGLKAVLWTWAVERELQAELDRKAAEAAAIARQERARLFPSQP